ncbi:MAG: hypothetical protein PHS44_07395 [Candidatus Dojkabacteria bacterium]|jgi:exonuclease VII small subunit|nr:hypothetical protein [Candidatus Dojkabacteria bacterium]
MALSVGTIEKKKSDVKYVVARKLYAEKDLFHFLKVDEKLLAKIFTAYASLSEDTDIAVDPAILSFIDSIADYCYGEKKEGKFWEPGELIDIVELMVNLNSSKLDKVLEDMYGSETREFKIELDDLKLIRRLLDKSDEMLDSSIKNYERNSQNKEWAKSFYDDLDMSVYTVKEAIAKMKSKRDYTVEIKLEESLSILRRLIEYLKYTEKRGVLVKFTWA